MKNLSAITICLTIALSGCSNIIFNTISSNYDHSINFKQFKTYAWLNNHQPHTATPYDNEIIENNIKNYVDKELEKILYVPQINAPDILFELIIHSRSKVAITRTPIYSSPMYGAYPSYSYMYYNSNNYKWNPYGYFNRNYQRPTYKIGETVERTRFNKSTIIINVFERISGKLIWTGSAKGDVYDSRYMKDAIHPAVIKILDKYPIQPAK
jgi:hypothetical protein